MVSDWANQELWMYGATQQNVQLDASSIATFYKFLVWAIEQIGLSIHSESRLKQYELLTATRCLHAEMDATQLLKLSFAYRELMQLAVIAYYGRLDRADQEYKDKVHKLLHDAANPLNKEKHETPGRDSQFELFLASCWTPISEYCSLSSPPHPDGVRPQFYDSLKKQMDIIPIF